MERQAIILVHVLLLIWIPFHCDALGEYSSYGCDSSSTITMTCPQDGDPDGASFIHVQNATYGQYQDNGCGNDPCCVPDEQDCEVPVEELSVGDWEAIVTACDMTEMTCGVEAILNKVVGGFCPPPSISNFQVVYYICVYADGSVPTTPAPTTTTTTTEAPTSTTTTAPPARSTTEGGGGGGGGGGSTNIGGIIGGVLGGICAVVIIVIVVLLCIRRREAKKAMADRHPRPISIGNGAIPKHETPVYDNPGYDEEMVMGEGKRVRATSKTESEMYENVPLSDSPDGKAKAKVEDEIDEDNVSQSTGTVYENMEVKANPNPYIEIVSPDKEQKNGSAPSAQKFEKKATTPQDKKAPVAKKAAPANPKLGKAASAMDVSQQPKMDKQSRHKQSAPNLGTELSTPVDVEALKEGAGLNKNKSQSAQELNRRSIAESSVPEDIKEENEYDEVEEDKGPGKELF